MSVVEDAEMLRGFSQARKNAWPGENFCLKNYVRGSIGEAAFGGVGDNVIMLMKFTRLVQFVKVVYIYQVPAVGRR